MKTICKLNSLFCSEKRFSNTKAKPPHVFGNIAEAKSKAKPQIRKH